MKPQFRMRLSLPLCSCFFQAEDGIRDIGVTGVQTCALPICSASETKVAERVQEQTGIPYALLDGRFAGIAGTYRTLGALIGRAEDAEKLARYTEDKIGRASCRERV